MAVHLGRRDGAVQVDGSVGLGAAFLGGAAECGVDVFCEKVLAEVVVEGQLDALVRVGLDGEALAAAQDLRDRQLVDVGREVGRGEGAEVYFGLCSGRDGRGGGGRCEQPSTGDAFCHGRFLSN
ncbi:hypothetical protein AB0F91_02385 [Amycolatopsis sp. NPDC023774]|uniref:hypothetical protein n=1 Tax=Amycolatopsis sp. NPDC023774 TaxID=3155015 RepID=UPI0033C822C3